MCDPVSMAAAAGGQAIVGEIVANDERIKANKLKDEAAALHREVFQSKVDSIAQDLASNQFASFEAKNQRKLEGLKAAALSQASASASGVQGLSVDAILADFDMQVGTGTSAIDQQLDLQKTAHDTTIKGLQLNTRGQLFNLRKEAFNPVAAALRIGSSAFGGFVQGKSLQGQKTPAPSASNPVATNTGQMFGPTRSDFTPTSFGPRRNFT